MERGCALAMVLIIGLSAPALANPPEKEAQAPKEKKICRTERVTGSLVAQRRICMSKEQWDKLALQTKSDLEDIQRNAGAISRTPNPDPKNQGGATAGFQ